MRYRRRMTRFTSVRFALLFAGAVAATTLSVGRGPARATTTYPDGLYRAIEADRYYNLCAKQEHTDPATWVRKISQITKRPLTSGATVYVAYVQDECVCSDGNCLTVAFVESPAGVYREVFSDTGFGIKFGADGSAVIRGNDDVAVSTRSMYQFDGTKYQRVSTLRVYNATGETKPEEPTPVQFATGTSSTTVGGTVRAGFEDVYSLKAAAGQTMSVVVTPIRGILSRNGVRIFNETQTASGLGELTQSEGALSWHGKLPSDGAYQIEVDGGGDAPATYTMSITIR